MWIPQTVLRSANTVADFPKLPVFLSNFERYNDLGICLWNPKQQRISEKSSNVADFATNLIFACCGFHLQFADSTYSYGFRNSSTIQMSYHLFVDSTNCSGFRKYSCRFRKIAYFLSNFEWYNDLGICLWNPKQHRISEKSSNVADSATNLILACCGFHLQLADCGFHLQLRIPQQLNSTIQMSYHLFVDSTNCSAFRKYSCGFCKFASFLSNFERYNDLRICLWNPKQHRISEKSSIVADSSSNLILACCGFQLQFADFTFNLRISLTICGFHLQFADSTYNLRIALTICGFHLQLRIPQQLNLTIKCLTFVCGFHKLFCVPQKQLRISQICLFSEQF